MASKTKAPPAKEGARQGTGKLVQRTGHLRCTKKNAEQQKFNAT
jgi:hypothetical protein